MRFVFKMIVFPFWLITAFLALMLKWTLNLSAFVLALPMLYIFGCGLYTLYCREWINSFMGMTSEWEMAQIEKALKCSLALDRENMNQERGNLFG